jgi:hypothetical protein
MRARNLYLIAALTTLLTEACSGSGNSDLTGSTAGALTGPVEIRAVNDDNAIALPLTPVTEHVTHIIVTVARVDAKVDAEGDGHDDDSDAWVTVATGPFTFDLLSLQGGSFATLGVTQLPASETDGLRLVLSTSGMNAVATENGQTFPLVVPSGAIRVVGDFDVAPCATGVITLQFAGRHAIELHPDANGDAYVLRPVIHVREVAVSGACPSREDGKEDDASKDRDHAR